MRIKPVVSCLSLPSLALTGHRVNSFTRVVEFPTRIAALAHEHGENHAEKVERADREWTVIVNHMRTRAGLTGGASRDVLAFLQATNGDAPREIGASEAAAETVRLPANVVISTDPATVAEGRVLVSSRGCIGCHVIDGLGGQIGPTLSGVVESKGALFVQQKMSDPSFDNAGTLMPNLGLSAEQVAALIAYIATLR